MKEIFIHAKIITMTDSGDYLDGALGIDGDKISYIGPSSGADLESYDRVIDCSRKIILPGLINAHCHAPMSLLRGFADDLPLKKWLEEEMWPIENRFEAEHIRAGTALSILEMIKSGTTCFLDMYDHMETVAEVVAETGIRARLSRGVIGFGSDEVLANKLQNAVSFAENWHGTENGRITTMLAPHSSYTCSPEYIAKFVDYAAKLGLPIHTHMSETIAEVEQNVAQYGERPVEHLRKIGVFNVPTVVAHAVHVTDDEINILKEYDVKIAHNPGSNCKLGSGIAPISSMFLKGIRPALGTDGAASNNNLDMLEEIHLAALIHKGFNLDPEAVPASVALQMGTIFGVEALFLDDQIGQLELGKKADFITLSTDGAHFQPLHDVVSHVVYSASRGDILDVYIDGKPIMQNRQCLTMDEEKICFEANEVFEKLR